MSNLVFFKPRQEANAQQNLAAFVALCRDELTIFGSDLPFDKMTWDLTAYIPLKAKNGALRVVFSSWATVNDRSPSAMDEPYLAFAKSYVRYQHGLRPVKAISSRVAATRALCEALAELGTADPVATDVRTLNRAAQLISTKFSDTSGYRVGLQLELLASFMDDNRLVATPLRWSNPLSRPLESTGRVGEEFESIRQQKLPSAYALDSLARAFHAATGFSDRIVTAIAAIMCSAPDRVSEVLGLRSECEVQSGRSNKPMAYGLRFWPSKGADPMIKWVVPSMSSVVQEALNRLRVASSEARMVAGWYESNPTLMFLPSHLEHLRNQDLSMEELNEVLFTEKPSNSAARKWCESNGVPMIKIGRKRNVKFSDVQRVVLQELPRNFPLLDVETGLRFSEALCVCRRNELHRERATFRCIIEAIDQNFVSTGLGNRSQHGFKSVFDNLGLLETDGSPIAIRTHQFRHYLNTLAHAGGMNELEIAKWSGRKDVRQNSTYNHVSDRDTQARLIELRQERYDKLSTELVPQVRISLFPRDKFKEMGIQAAHTTDFGMCVHDFVMSPCPLHLDCTNCNEQICIKGDELGEVNARAKHAETGSLLAKAEAAKAEGYYGATRWVEHQRLTYERLSELIAILDDAQVPKGALIRLTHIKPASRFQHAVDAREALSTQIAETPLLKWIIVEQGAKK